MARLSSHSGRRRQTRKALLSLAGGGGAPPGPARSERSAPRASRRRPSASGERRRRPFFGKTRLLRKLPQQCDCRCSGRWPRGASRPGPGSGEAQRLSQAARCRHRRLRGPHEGEQLQQVVGRHRGAARAAASVAGAWMSSGGPARPEGGPPRRRRGTASRHPAVSTAAAPVPATSADHSGKRHGTRSVGHTHTATFIDRITRLS